MKRKQSIPRISDVSLCAIVMAVTLGAPSLSAGHPPLTPTQSRRGPTVYVEAANLQRWEPYRLVPNGPLMVTLSVKLATPVAQDELIHTLKVFIDAVEAEPRPSLPAVAAPETTASAASSTDAADKSATRDEVGITLFVVAPKQLASDRKVVLSVFSTLDNRVIATTVAEAEKPRSLAFGLQSLLSPAGWVLIVCLPLLLGILPLVRQRQLARNQIQRLQLAVQVERQRVNALSRSGEAEDIVTSLGAQGSAPELPEEVMEALERRDLVLVLGMGVSAQSGLPTSRSLWLNVLDRYAGQILPSQLEGLRSLITTDGTDAAVEPIVSLVGRNGVLVALRDELFGSGARPSHFHELLAGLPVPAILDITWDDLMLRALAGRAVKVFGPTRQDGISEALRAGQLAVIKLLGDVRQPDSVVLTGHEYRRMLTEAPEFERSIAALFSTRTLLFFGFSLHGLEQFLTSLPPQLESTGRGHFAVLPTGSGLDLWQAGLGKRYGVTLVGFRPSADYKELLAAAEALTARVSTDTGQARGTDTRLSLNASRLTYLQLRSVGIFRNLKVEFTPRWTLLLGNNGGGKSTILRAVALALAGNDPRATLAAQKLLRTGENSGTIELGIGNAQVVTNLVRDGQTVLVKSPQTTALQAGQILVLAFPALRGVTTVQVRGPTTMAAPDPSVDDLAPLLEGVVDNRLNNLKQWVVNTALRAESSPSGREARMLNTFQRLIAEMVPGGGLEFARVDRQTWQVILRAEYGEVPFEGISQGMSSILNWIGVLLQRLYDVYPRSEMPEQEPAIVLIDEIDAHLHPEWQRRLVALTRNYFPEVQIIASSHSPLLAGAVERAELRVVAKNYDTGEIQALMPPEDLSGHKAEDILVSSLFSLQTTRSIEAEETIRRYFALFQKTALSPDEQSELDDLSVRLRALSYGATLAERDRIERARSQVDDVLSKVSVDEVRAVNERLTAGLSSDGQSDPRVKGTQT